ncbi:hypothetical protein AB0L80_19090 [Streptomyces sp. NPDC052069]|uniref:hypothetical protein n=1 Tax=Streptomyces sp. NPDC052069 TaxID=3154650 RepID=UPI00342C5304
MNAPTPHREEVTVLYARFDHLPYPARMRAIAEHTRSLDDEDYRAARAALDTADPDDRRLALFLAVVRRDLETVALALADPVLRPRALSAAIRLPVPEQALESLALGPLRAVRHDTYRVLRLSRRRALADRILPRVQELHGDEDAARLLPACTPDAVGQWLPRLSGVPQGILFTLTRTAPRALAAHLADRAPSDGRDQWEAARPRDGSRQLVSRLTAYDPAAGALLLERAPHLVTGPAALVLLREPAAVAASLRRTGTERVPLAPGPLSRRVRRALDACGPQDAALLADVLRVEHDIGGPTDCWTTAEPLLALLPPAARRRAVEARLEGSRGRWTGLIGPVASLDPADRTEIAGRLLNGRAGRRAYPRTRIASLLPPAEAEPLLRELSAAHRPWERALAWAALLRCVNEHRDPQAYARVLLSCERAWHDQEEVRRTALLAAGAAHGPLLDAAPFAALRDAATTTVQSRDSTAQTLRAAEKWLRRTALRAVRAGDAERAAAVVGLLVQVLDDPRGSGDVRPLDMTGAGARAVWERCGTPRPAHVLLFAGLFARHLAQLPALDGAVGRAALDDPHGERGRRAAALLLADPVTRERRCAELLAADVSFVAVSEVWRTLSRRRTDLLDTVMGADLPSRWAPRQARAGLGRWLPRQRALLDAQLARVAADEDVPLRERADAAALLGDTEALYALVAGAPQPVAAAACGALGERAAERGGAAAHPRTLDFLLDRAGTGGVRGRAAMAGARTLLATVPDEEAVARFARMVRDTDGSVGGRKAAVRGLSALSSPNATAALLAGWDAPGQHRDVHAAMAGPLAARMDAPGIGERLAAQLHHPAVRERVLAARPDRAAAAGARYRFLARTVATAERSTAVQAAHALRGPGSADGPVRGTMAAVAGDPERPREVRGDALDLLCEWAVPGPRHGELVTVLGVLVAQARSGAPEERRAALWVLGEQNDAYRERPAGALDAVADALERAGLAHSASRVALTAALTALAVADASPERWERWLGLAGERPGHLDQVRDHRRTPTNAQPVGAIAAVAGMLRAHGSVTAGLAAVHLVVRGGESTSWAQPWVDGLDALRASGHPEVAEAALLADLRRPVS